jgi:hypothetical protein
VLALLTGTGVTVTGKPASAADSPAPGSGQDGPRAGAEQVRGDLLDGPPARPSAMADRNEDKSAGCDTGREEAGT